MFTLCYNLIGDCSLIRPQIGSRSVQLITGRAVAAAGMGKVGGGLVVSWSSSGHNKFPAIRVLCLIRYIRSQIRFQIRSEKVLLMIGSCGGESGGKYQQRWWCYY